jgi:hypothetical protein
LRSIVAVAAIAITALIAASASLAKAPPPYTCTGGQIPAGTYTGLIVAPGAECYIAEGDTVTVNGNASVVGEFSYLEVDGTLHVTGSLSVGADSEFVASPVFGEDGGAAPIVNVDGNVSTGSGSYFFVGVPSPSAPAAGEIKGSFGANDAESLFVGQMTIDGNAAVTDGGFGFIGIGPFAAFLFDTIKGNLGVTGYQGGFVAIESNTVGTLSNAKSGNVTVSSNTVIDDIEIAGNSIQRNLSCDGNTPAPDNFAGANTVGGHESGQCAGF